MSATEAAEFFDFASDELGVDAITVSYRHSYERAPDQEHFCLRKKTKTCFATYSAFRSLKVGIGLSGASQLFNFSSETKNITVHHGVWLREMYLVGSVPVIF